MSLFFYLGIVAAGLVSIISLLIVVLWLQLPPPIKCDFRKKHIFITGGSKGIGKAIAVEALRKGCSCVTIVARTLDSLSSAAEDLTAYCGDNQSVQYFQLDVSSTYKEIESVVRTAETGAASVMGGDGGVDILINNAGTVIQGDFEGLAIDAFLDEMKTNFLSSVYTTRAVVGRMKANRQGHITFVSSAAGQCSIWGYSAYSPSKFAIRGFADALHMELLPFNIGVTVLYPPNTDTEGFKDELKTMTTETRELSNSAGLFLPSVVASALIDSMTLGHYMTTIGMEGWMLGTLSAGAAPEPNFLAACYQTLLAGILRSVMLIYLGNFNGIVQRCHLKKHQKIQ